MHTCIIIVYIVCIWPYIVWFKMKVCLHLISLFMQIRIHRRIFWTNNASTSFKESSKTRTTPSRPASIATNTTTTSSCRAQTPHNTKTRSCRRASASFAMGMSINTRTQDESKRPRQHIKSRSKRNSAKQDRKPNSSLHQQQQQQQQQPPLSKPHHQPSARSVYSKPKISMV